MAAVEFTQVVSRGCGMDIHKEVVVATVRGDGIQKETRSFDTSLWMSMPQPCDTTCVNSTAAI